MYVYVVSYIDIDIYKTHACSAVIIEVYADMYMECRGIYTGLYTGGVRGGSTEPPFWLAKACTNLMVPLFLADLIMYLWQTGLMSPLK